VTYVQSSAMLTGWKRSDDLAYLNAVSSVPLQQALRNMTRNHRLARAISDAVWHELRAMLEYKCGWYGRHLVVINCWYPSSKTCSACGHVASLPLSTREWGCSSCGARHDRDINAARNIRAAGLAVLACGADVRPHRESSLAGGRR
jgi:putative transposase